MWYIKDVNRYKICLLTFRDFQISSIYIIYMICNTIYAHII